MWCECSFVQISSKFSRFKVILCFCTFVYNLSLILKILNFLKFHQTKKLKTNSKFKPRPSNFWTLQAHQKKKFIYPKKIEPPIRVQCFIHVYIHIFSKISFLFTDRNMGIRCVYLALTLFFMIYRAFHFYKYTHNIPKSQTSKSFHRKKKEMKFFFSTLNKKLPHSYHHFGASFFAIILPSIQNFTTSSRSNLYFNYFTILFIVKTNEKKNNSNEIIVHSC